MKFYKYLMLVVALCSATLGAMQQQEESATILALNQSDYEKFFSGVKNGDAATVSSYLSKGIDVDRADDVGYPPLCLAARRGKAEMVELLMQAGADINKATSNGWTPLNLAISGNNIDNLTIVKLLLRSLNVDVDKASIDIPTPLKMAVSRGYREIVNLLIKRDATMDQSTINVARNKWHWEIATNIEDEKNSCIRLLDR